MKYLSVFKGAIVLALLVCGWPQNTRAQQTVFGHVDWSRNATIYEVNIRQFTPEGTFNAFAKHLPRLQKMGIDILWLMPVNPLGEKNRKGSLGSYYSVSDYLAVNPEYGTMEDFKAVVKTAHKLGMKVIIDWVANHTSWDNPLITAHPEWYKKDARGNIVPPVADWTDVAALDYSNRELWGYMNDALSFWIEETDIDGYRCDVAGMMPVSYWNQAIPELRKLKPLFMLAEDESPKMHDTAFDATYAWGFHHLMNDIARGKKTAGMIDSVYATEKKNYPPDAYRMLFTSNHDENSWNGTEYERMGDAAKAFAVLTFTFPGIPLVYSGQEAAMNKRLRFFDKDTIPWGDYPLEQFYSKLTALKHANNLLDAGDKGGKFIKVASSDDSVVYAFLRKSETNQILVILNLSGQAREVKLKGNEYTGSYQEVFSGRKHKFVAGETIKLSSWGYYICEKK